MVNPSLLLSFWKSKPALASTLINLRRPAAVQRNALGDQVPLRNYFLGSAGSYWAISKKESAAMIDDRILQGTAWTFAALSVLMLMVLLAT